MFKPIPTHLRFTSIFQPYTWIRRGSRNPSENRRVHSGKTWSLSETLGYTWYFCCKLWQKWPVRWPSSQVSVVRIQQWTSCGWQRDGILAYIGSRLANVMHPTRPLSPMLSQRWCMAELQDVARCCKAWSYHAAKQFWCAFEGCDQGSISRCQQIFGGFLLLQVETIRISKCGRRVSKPWHAENLENALD